MTMSWSQDKCDACTPWELDSERRLRVHAEAPVPGPTSEIDNPLTTRVETEAVPASGSARWRMWFVGRDVMLAALAGAMIFFVLSVTSLGVLGSALTVAGVVAAVGLGHYLLWGRVFARAAVRERQRVQDQADRSGTSEAEPPDECSLGINDRERRELLRLLEHSLAAATDGGEGSEDGAAIRRELRERVRMFGA